MPQDLGVGVSVRFVPAGIYTDSAGKTVARGAIVLIPASPTETQYSVQLDRWPTDIQQALEGLHVFFKAATSTSLPITTPGIPVGGLVKMYEKNNLDVAQRVWGELLAPSWQGSPKSSTAELLIRTFKHGQSPTLADAALALESRWAALQAVATASSAQTDAQQFLATAAPNHVAAPAMAGISGTPRVSCAPLAKTAQLLNSLDSIRVIDAVCRAAGSPQGLAFEKPKPAPDGAGASDRIPAAGQDYRRLRWTGLPDLFSGPRVEPAPDPADNDWTAWTLPRVAARGLSKAMKTAADHAAEKRFRYLAPPPQPRPRLTGLLAGKIKSAIEAHTAIADNVFKRTMTFLKSGMNPDEADLRRSGHGVLGNTGVMWMGGARGKARWPAKTEAARAIYDAPANRVANALWPQATTAGTPSPPADLSDLHSATQSAVAMHLIDVRPDKSRDLSRIHIDPMDLNGKDPTEALNEVEKLASDAASAPQRRLFGLLAYPALARALRLVIDVEFSLPTEAQLSMALPDGRGSYFLWFGASLDAHDEQIPLWTASKFRSVKDQFHFGVCSQEEMVATAQKLHTLDGDDNPNPPQFEGIVTLGGDFDGGGSRFALESLDVVTRLEQYVNSSDGEANAEQSGQSRDHAGASVGPPRTAGLVLHDRGRSVAVTTQIAGAVHVANQSGTQQPGTPTSPKALFANDLNVGFRPDVAVISRKATQGKPAVEWRHLSDRWITFDDDVEKLVEGTLAQAVPRNMSVPEFRVAIDALGVKFPTRVIVHGQPSLDDKAKAAQQVAQEIVIQWLGPPPGAPPSDSSDSDAATAQPIDPATDLPLSVTLDLVSKRVLGDKVSLPPWLEIGRGFRIGMAGICLGGISVPLEEAKRTYALTVLPLTVPPTPKSDPDPSGFFVFRRHEPVAAPVVALLYQGKGVPPKDPRGDTLTDIVVRSQNFDSPEARKYAPTARSARVVFVRGVPESFAALHPIQPAKNVVPHNILRDLRVVSGQDDVKRLCGGFQFVALDSRSGGLPNGWQRDQPQYPKRVLDGTPLPKPVDVSADGKDCLFWITGANNDDMAAREAQYFPDPAVSGFVIEATINGPRQNPAERRFVPIYDNARWQPVTRGLYQGEQRERVQFPHAMPIYLEVNALSEKDAAQSGSILAANVDVGSIREGGAFSTGTFQSPAITAMRVTVNLAPGEAVDLRIWSSLSEEVIGGWFQSNEQIVALASAVGGAGADELNPAAAISGLERMFGTTEKKLSDLGQQGIGFSAQALGQVSAVERTDLAAVRRLVARNIARALKSGPITGLSQEVSLTATHAILRPRFAPTFVRRDALNGPALLITDQDPKHPVGILRHTFNTSDKWSDWLKVDPHRDVSFWPRWGFAWPPVDALTDFHEPGALAAWFGGIAALDLGTTSHLILRASYLDVYDDPVQWPSKNNPLDNGKPKFHLVSLELFRTADLQKETSRELIKDAQGNDLDVIDLLEASDGTVRALSWQFQDTRARHLSLQYVALSRYWNYFFQHQDFKPNAMPASPAAFEFAGDVRKIWLPSTKRPDPIAKVEFLPAFVYVTEEGVGERSRHFRARLRMRRATAQDGGWYSSGEGEQLAVILWPPDLFNPRETNIQDEVDTTSADKLNTVNFQLGPGGVYVSRWGSDPILEGGQDPTWLMSRKVFAENIRRGTARFVNHLNPGSTDPKDAEPIYMPIPAPDPASAPGGSSPPPPLQVCLLCFDPIYDPIENLWFVDIAIDPGAISRPFVRLGLARFQEHSLRGLEVSEPITLQFPLQPYRRIRVQAREKATAQGWPIEIAVYGPKSVVVGGRGVTDPKVEPAQAAYQQQRSPQFSVKLLHDDMEYLGQTIPVIGACSDETDLDSEVKSGCAPFGPDSSLGPPPDDEIWRAVIYAPKDPADDHHDVIVEEVDLMLRADIDNINQSTTLASTGPRFAAKMRVRRRPDGHH